MGKSYNFNIPEPRGLEAKVPKKLVERNLKEMKPTDKNQLPPTPDAPMPQRYRMAGGG